jgi:predicted PurR-regulated permease PerM
LEDERSGSVPPAAPGAVPRNGTDTFLGRVVTILGLLVLLFIAWKIRHALLVGFAGVVVAILLDAAARPIRRFTPLSQPAAVSLAGVLVLLAAIVLGWFLWPQVQAQGMTFVEQIRTTLAGLQERYGPLLPDGDSPATTGMLQDIAGFITSWSASALGALASLLLVVITGTFLASAPELYRDGAVRLLPPAEQPRMRRALDRCGRGLRGWLRAQLISMAIVGIGVTLGTWAIGLPSPVPLGVLAMVAEFVPILGPLAAAVPALLLATDQGLPTLLWTGGFYILLQQVESNLVLPILGQEVARIPPALLLVAVAAFGYLFGIAGVLVSAPLTAAMVALVDELYVKRINATDS